VHRDISFGQRHYGGPLNSWCTAITSISSATAAFGVRFVRGKRLRSRHVGELIGAQSVAPLSFRLRPEGRSAHSSRPQSRQYQSSVYSGIARIARLLRLVHFAASLSSRDVLRRIALRKSTRSGKLSRLAVSPDVGSFLSSALCSLSRYGRSIPRLLSGKLDVRRINDPIRTGENVTCSVIRRRSSGSLVARFSLRHFSLL